MALRGKGDRPNDNQQQHLGDALQEARRHKGFWFLTAGFFVYGFHVAFIAVHLPACLTDQGSAATLHLPIDERTVTRTAATNEGS